MPKVHHVKKARRALPQHGIEVGDAYYWWANRIGRSSIKKFSKTPPKASQLTSSEFLSTAYSINEAIQTLEASESLAEDRDDIVSQIEDLKSETEDKLSNMPESLQQGPTGELLQSRIDACDEWANNLNSVDVPDWDSTDFHKEEDEDEDDQVVEAEETDDGEVVIDEEKRDAAFEEALSEIQSYTYEGE